MAAALLDAAGNDVSARKDLLARGVNVSHLFWLPRFEYATPRWDFKGWASNDIARQGFNDDDINDWEDYVNTAFPKREAQKVKDAGFTYVRLPVDLRFLFDFDEANPYAGGTMRGDNFKLLRSKVREITDQGLGVVISLFRTDNTTNSFDLQIWDPAWQQLLNGFVFSFTRQISRFTRDFDPNKVILQPFNEPHLSEIWRAGQWEDGDWVVRNGGGDQLLRIRPFSDQPIDELTVDSSAWGEIQNALVRQIRRVDTGRKFTVLTSTPLDMQVTFKSGAEMGDTIYALEANRNVVSGTFAEAALITHRDYDATQAMDRAGTSLLVTAKTGGYDRNVVYGVHYYGNGIVSSEQGDYYSADFSLIYPLPFYIPPLEQDGESVQFVDGTNLPRTDSPNALTALYNATFQRTLGLIQQRLGIDANGDTLDESQWVGLDYDVQFIRDRRQSISENATGDVYQYVKNHYLDLIVPEVAKLFRYDLRSGSPTAIRDAIDLAQRWADRTDLDKKKSGRQRPFVVFDEFGIRDHTWQLFGDTYRYVNPFEGVEYERNDWINTVRSNIEGVAADNGSYREKMGWAAWDYLGEMAITEPETVGGADPFLYGTPSQGTVFYSNVLSYRRRLNGDVAAALGLSPYEF